ncbi:hypothetical protein PG999_009699 [Apiospora kogelbergensis]|uniref:Uncharacterized protein n=1 Tax=Apiospora kogelbergensis TaxID=1337665 RepID=A0AAW0QK97_9PEZI
MNRPLELREDVLGRQLELVEVGVLDHAVSVEAVGRRLAAEQQLQEGLELVAVDVARHVGGAGRGQLVGGDQGRPELDDVGVLVRVPVVAVEQELVRLQQVLVVHHGAGHRGRGRGRGGARGSAMAAAAAVALRRACRAHALEEKDPQVSCLGLEELVDEPGHADGVGRLVVSLQ